jgi:hypothetical protein
MILVLELVDFPTFYQVWSGWFWYWNWWILLLYIRSGLDGSGTGTGGSSYSGKDQSYPGVPYSSQVYIYLHFRRFVTYILFQKLKNH